MKTAIKKNNLNFKVYTVEAKPSTPGAENDIAIISSVPMTNWLMSPDAPSGIPRNDGDVWIQYSVSGNTKNILKQNSLVISTIRAWQYVDGAWVDREAVSCQGGEWVAWFTGKYLYNLGDECDDITGGWGTTGYAHNTYTVVAGKKQGEYFELTGATNKLSTLGTINAVNVDNYKRVYIDCEPTSYTGTGASARSINLLIVKNKNALNTVLYTGYFTELKRQTGYVEIPAGTGNVYIVVTVSATASCAGKVYKVWLE